MIARPASPSWPVVAAYGALGAVLVLTRTIGLHRSLWHDEVVAVVRFIREGPREILAGPDVSHELFGLLAWATTSLAGESEVTLRLWSVFPFLAGVVAVSAWLHVRLGALAGALFVVFATASPLLLDITRQARGYGLAFLAMSVLVLAALEASRTGSPRALLVFGVAGVAGAWTLPQLGIAFVATGMALLTDGRIRRRAGIALAASSAAIAAWYAPHLGEVRDASRIEDGVRIGLGDLLVSPFHHVLTPALLWLDGTVVSGTAAWLPLAALGAIVVAYSPLLHDRRTALVLGSGIAATLVALWLAEAYVVPRYLSFLLVPLFMLLASGVAGALSRFGSRLALVGILASVTLLTLCVLSFSAVVADVLRYPREAYRDAVETVERTRVDDSVVLAYVRNPDGLDFYLDRPVRALHPDEVRAIVCAGTRRLTYVTQPFGIPQVDVPCLESRPGVKLYRHRQYARGGRMDVWTVPPS